MAFIALMAADLGVNPAEYRKWAKGQIHYALGDSGRSYVVGFGTNYPKRPHHRARYVYLMSLSYLLFQVQNKHLHTL